MKKIFTRGAYLLTKGKRRTEFHSHEHRKTGSNFLLRSFLDLKSLSQRDENSSTFDFFLNKFLDHRFDLLGSGWVKWNFDGSPNGLEGWKYEQERIVIHPDGGGLEKLVAPNHLERSRQLWQMIDDQDHTPIDWQRDLKSGFRWDARKWSGDQGKLNSGKIGADPKIPLELGRLQHLPRMALFVREKGKGKREKVIGEFRSQVLDFIATNPPGMGINWYYSMDVGIRVANLLLAYDLFTQMDDSGILDKGFQMEFSSSIACHARFIRSNLEFQDGLTGNHYLFNIAGLLFAGAYLDGNDESNEWFAFGMEEMIKELFKQFFSDGANFEGSTAYHRFAVEMMVWCTALVQGNKVKLREIGWNREIRLSKWSHGITGKVSSTSDQPFSPAYLHRLFQACRATYILTKPNGEHPQIGDNDSGRLFRLTPLGKFRTQDEMASLYEGIPAGEEVFDENMLEQNTLLSAIMGLWQGASFNIKEPTVERDFIDALTKGDPLQIPEEKKVKEIPFTEKGKSFDGLSFSEQTKVLLEGKTDGRWTFLPQAGWYIYAGPDLFLLINAPSGKGIRHTWGHVQNDRLSFELYQNGKDVVVDPGAYIYGALPAERNRFRSVEVHNTLVVEGQEQNRWREDPTGLFFLEQESRCFLLDYGEDYLEVGLHYRGIRQKRKFLIDEGALILEDHSNQPFRVELNKGELHSRGYGKKLRPSS